eukprot:4630582-Pyramimonas_sp.AAC.1
MSPALALHPEPCLTDPGAPRGLEAEAVAKPPSYPRLRAGSLGTLGAEGCTGMPKRRAEMSAGFVFGGCCCPRLFRRRAQRGSEKRRAFSEGSEPPMAF